MSPEYLDRYLERGQKLGFTFDTGDDADWAVVEVWKEMPRSRAAEVLDQDEVPPWYARRQEEAREHPYVVSVEVQTRALRKSAQFDDPDSYKVREIRTFATLDEVDRFTRTYGRSVFDINGREDVRRWQAEEDG